MSHLHTHMSHHHTSYLSCTYSRTHSLSSMSHLHTHMSHHHTSYLSCTYSRTQSISSMSHHHTHMSHHHTYLVHTAERILSADHILSAYSRSHSIHFFSHSVYFFFSVNLGAAGRLSWKWSGGTQSVGQQRDVCISIQRTYVYTAPPIAGFWMPFHAW